VNIYTDSKYAFAPLHMHGARYKERGQLMAGRKEIKNKEETLQLLEAVWELSQVAIIHYRGQQRGLLQQRKPPGCPGSKVPEQTAKLLLAPELHPTPYYIKEEEKRAKDEKRNKRGLVVVV
jgi:hypothetical protein